MTDATNSKPAMSKGRLAWVALGGLVILGSPYLLRLDLIEDHPDIGDFGSVAAITSGVLVNVGTTVLLGVLFIAIEPWFQKRVRKSAAEGAEEAIRRETATLVQANAALSSRVDDLQSQVEDRVASARRERADVYGALGSEISWDAVCDALELANTLEILADGRIFVPASSQFTGPIVEFYWGTHASLQLKDLDSQGFGLSVACQGATIDWQEGDTFEQLAESLEQEMTRIGAAQTFDLIEWPLVPKNLSRALSDATSAKRNDSSAWFSGPLYGVIADGWAVTKNGLEVRDHGNVVRRDDFPIVQMKKSGGAPPTEKEYIERPAWADEETWQFALDTTRPKHTRYGYPAAGSLPDHQGAFTRETSPRSSGDA